MNQEFTIIGNVGSIKIPEEDRQPVRVRIATEKDIKRDGQWEKVTSWFTIVFFGLARTRATQALRVGQGIVVKGDLEPSSFTDKAGRERHEVNLIARDFTVTRWPSSE